MRYCNVRYYELIEPLHNPFVGLTDVSPKGDNVIAELRVGELLRRVKNARVYRAAILT